MLLPTPSVLPIKSIKCGNHININPIIQNNTHTIVPNGVIDFFLYEEYILGRTNNNIPIVTIICINIICIFI